MRRVVLDASALMTWFGPGASSRLRAEYEGGALAVVAPRRLTVDVLSTLARAPGWPADRLMRVSDEMDRLGFEFREPPIGDVAGWLARGLAPDRATYAALAEHLDLPLASADPELLRRASSVARSPDDA